MWRMGYKTPPNYNDNQLFCGGFYTQYTVNGGKCGICGDPWNGKRENEAGGKYANGIITKRYKEGSQIQVKVLVTAAHKGYFEFRICPNNDVNKPATHECLDRYILRTKNGQTRYPENGQAKMYTVDLQLPVGLTCQQCVMQWKYNAGNSYGVSSNGTGCIGCGNQEQFYSCADVAIDSDPSATGPNSYGKNTSNSSETILKNFFLLLCCLIVSKVSLSVRKM
ncbi:hypothetical protein FSP39_019870 [Pinctada imbricata]|uniref:Chitin-binding type-4 domain-containing protein n=1 Tax=Pinctada imbricata TaxID=66713 RepID=A0AA89BKV4_PINIB|nr:hypothetical protein FSP39_019870 [Pinctada imbricata]